MKWPQLKYRKVSEGRWVRRFPMHQRLGNEVLVNGDFATAGAGDPDFFGSWVETVGNGAIASEATLFHSVAPAAKLTAGAGTNTKLAYTATVAAREIYLLEFWTRAGTDTAGRYGVYDVSNSDDIVAAVTTGVAGTTYTKVSQTFATPAGCTSIRIDLWCPGTNAKIAYFDDVSLRLMQ